MRRFLLNLAEWALIGLICLVILATLGAAIVFVVTLVQHFAWDPDPYCQPDFSDCGNPNDIVWWALAAALAGFVISVALITLAEYVDGFRNYCPNCRCRNCVRERERRRRNSEVMTAAAVGGAIGASIGSAGDG